MITRAQQDSFVAMVKVALANRSKEADYPNIYLTHIIDHLDYFVKIYTIVLNRGLKLAGVEMNKARLVDLGAGNGMLSFFAKFCGFREVYINDIDHTFIEASKDLAGRLSILPTDFIEGDIEDVCRYFNENDTPEIIVGTDMIEHVYNLEAFFESLFSLKKMKAVVFTTAANPANYSKVRKLRKIQYNDEYIGGYPGEYLLYGSEAMRPFLEIRKDIIRQTYPQLNESTIDELAVLTRGLIKGDIENTVKQYIHTKVMPAKHKDPHNTCNPINGSWSERIISFDDYIKLFSKQGAHLFINAGFYNGCDNNIKSKLLSIFNLIIPLFGLRLAPFIVLSAANAKHK